MIARSPCVGVKLPSGRQQEPRFLSPEELERLSSCIAPRYRALVLLGGYAGLRLGELAGLRAERIDFLRRRVWSPRHRGGRRPAAPTDHEDGSGAGRDAPMLVVEELAAQLSRFPPGPDGLVFTAPRGGTLRAGAFRTRAWAPALEAAGLAMSASTTFATQRPRWRSGPAPNRRRSPIGSDTRASAPRWIGTGLVRGPRRGSCRAAR